MNSHLSSGPGRAGETSFGRNRTMKFAAGSALVAGLLALVAGCTQKTPQVNINQADSTASGITVVGTGEISGTPDTLTVSLGVSLKRPKVDAAITDAAARARKVIDALKAAGVADRDIQTQQYSVSPEYRYDSGPNPIPDGFRVSNMVVARLRDLGSAGKVLDAAAAAGGDDTVIQGVSFTLDDDADALAKARAAAMDDAKLRATQFAKAGGASVGRVESIREESSSQPVQVPMAEARQAADSATPIQAGEVTTRVQVTVRYTLD